MQAMKRNGMHYPATRVLATALTLAALIALPPSAARADETEEAPRGSAQLTLDDLRTFTDVFNQVRRNYVEEIDDHTLLDAAIRGMLQDLDPHSAYLPSETYRQLEDSSQGRYTGIGIDVEATDGRLIVRAVINDSPADLAGINPGDIITAIDGRPVRGRYLPDAVDDLLGAPGSQVELVVEAPNGEVRPLTVERKSLAMPVLSYRDLGDSWGYFKLTMFHRSSGKDLRESLESIRSSGVDLRGLVLDLRGNPGGVLQGAVEMADGFLDEGVILTTRGRNSTMKMEYEAHQGQWLSEVPVMILVDRGTASASEVFAGALQDHGRATLVGERTFGKGSVQSVLPLRNGGGIKLTTARYYTPSGRSIQAEGIRPDVLYLFEGDSRRGREADLDRHLEREAAAGGQVLEDAAGQEPFPLDEALALLEAAGILSPIEEAAAEDEEEQP